MNQPKPSIWKRPILPGLSPFRFVRRLFGWRMMRRYLFCFACLTTLIAIFYAEENWRGRRAWEAYRRELTAQGVNLDWLSMVPPPLPDEQNFAQTPLLAPLFDFNPEPLKPGQSRWRDTNGYQRVSSLGRELFDKPPAGGHGDAKNQFEAWMLALAPKPGSTESTNFIKQKIDTASEVLLALQKHASELEEIRAASQRPGSRFNIKYDSENPSGILLPHLGIVKWFALTFEARALAELAVGQNDAAFKDLETIFALADAMKTEPFIISVLVRISILQTCAQTVMVEGLSGHAWSAAQLQELQARLRRYALLKDTDRCLNAERAMHGSAVFELLRRNPRLYVDEVGMFYNWGEPMTFLLRVVPQGWIYQEQITYLHGYGEQMLPVGELESGRVRPKLVAERMTAMNKNFAGSAFSALWHHKLIAGALALVPAISYQKPALAQTALDQAFTACGLERYRLANGHYPDTLASLTPQFASVIPNDVITGEPPKYHLTEGGSFVLYSMGWNEKDDGGKTVLRKGNARMDPNQGDWVWGAWGQMTE